MIEIIRWLKGYVKLKIWGYAPERFMNLCTNAGISLWKVSGNNGYYELYMSVADFFSIRRIAKKTRTRVLILEKHGFPFFIKDVRKRKLFTAGLIGCLIFLLIMSRFLWSVEFVGNQQITDDVLMDFLETKGIHYGSKMRELDPEKLEDDIRESFSLITWTSVRIDGTKLTVQVKENDLPKWEEQLSDASKWVYGADIVAAKDGEIVEILTRNGIPQVKEADVVEKGTVLVSGQIPVNNDDGTVREWQYCVSDADILIRYEKPIQIDQPFYCSYKNYTGKEQKIPFITFGSRRLFFGIKDKSLLKCEQVVEQKRIRLFSQIDLPIFTGTLTLREYLPVDSVYDENSAKNRLVNRFHKILEGLEEKGVQIIQKDVKIIRKTDGLKLTGILTVQEEAVVLSPAEPTEEQEHSEDGEA